MFHLVTEEMMNNWQRDPLSLLSSQVPVIVAFSVPFLVVGSRHIASFLASRGAARSVQRLSTLAVPL